MMSLPLSIIISIIICTIDVPKTEIIVRYSLLIFHGIMKFIGYYAMGLAVKDPPVPSLFGGQSRYGFPFVFYICTDELFAQW